jgi:hypothetical protein
MFAWIRSYLFFDSVSLSTGFLSIDVISSSSGFLYWSGQKIAEPELGTPFWTSGRFAEGSNNDPTKSMYIRWYGPWHLFGVYKVSHGRELPTTIWLVPYWLVIFLMTLLSARLLLSKSAVKKDTALQLSPVQPVST